MIDVKGIVGLTKEPELKEKDGRNYYLLRVAKKEFERRDGDYVRDENDYKVVKDTFYFSVFVNDHCKGALNIPGLKPGDHIFISGSARLRVELDSENHRINIIDNIVAHYIQTNPFNQPLIGDSQEDVSLDDIPLEA